MSEAATTTPVKKASTPKTILFWLLMIVIFFFLGWFIFKLVHAATTTNNSPTPVQKAPEGASPDQVKQKTQNGDTNPAPTGTGPGSSNSILGQ